MTPRFLPPVALALAALPLVAQTRPALPLIPRTPPAAQEPQPDVPAGSYEALVRAYDDAQRAWLAGYRKAAAEGEEAGRAWLTATPRPTQDFVAKFKAGAEARAGTADAVPFLVWLAQNDYANVATWVDTLVTAHADSPALEPVAGMLVYGRDPAAALAALNRLAEASPHDGVRLAAVYGRAQVRMRGAVDDATRALVEQDLRTVIDSGHARYAPRAKGALFELQNLRIGLVAPDIEGEDLDGVPFKLSDYRGKVVVLDFWGDW